MLLTKSPLLHSSLNLYLSFYLYRCIQLTYIQLSLASCSLYISLSPYPDHKISSPLSLTLYLYFSLYMWVSISECFSLCLCGFIYIYLSLFLTILFLKSFFKSVPLYQEQVPFSRSRILFYDYDCFTFFAIKGSLASDEAAEQEKGREFKTFLLKANERLSRGRKWSGFGENHFFVLNWDIRLAW